MFVCLPWEQLKGFRDEKTREVRSTWEGGKREKGKERRGGKKEERGGKKETSQNQGLQSSALFLREM